MIEDETRGQSSCQIWFHERSKRIIASMFGRVLNRREKIFPKSIIDTLRKKEIARKCMLLPLNGELRRKKLHWISFRRTMAKVIFRGLKVVSSLIRNGPGLG